MLTNKKNDKIWRCDSEDFFQTQTGDWFIYPENWIRSGTDSTDFIGIDDSQSFEKILNLAE